MRETKLIEVRDRMTFMPFLAVRVSGSGDPLLRRAGFGPDPLVLFVDLNGMRVQYDPYSWTCLARTIPTAHRHVADNWDALPDGAVVDVEFIAGETLRPKESEA